MKLLIPITINIVLVMAVYLADTRTSFKKLPFIAKQLIIGVMFGALSCFASNFGVEILGTVANVRDAAPLSAGLLFGAPAGIISGTIGGLYRWFSVYWGAGVYTRLACTLATILAGFMAAVLRKFMFDNKKPTLSYAIAITLLCEVVHMLLIFVTNVGDSVNAFAVVSAATIPMMIGNVAAVGLSLVVVSLISKEGWRRKKRSEQITETFQRWLLVCIVCAYLLTSLFTFVLQNGMVSIETQEMFRTAITDVKTDVRGKSDAKILEVAYTIKEQYDSNENVSLIELAIQNKVVEVNIISKEGIIVKSTDSSFVGFDMSTTEQSKEFLVLNKGQVSFVQEYGPIGLNETSMRKYAGIALDDGGFIQVGYYAEQFHRLLNEFVVDVTKNRHVGTNGFIAVCDENLNLVTQTYHNGRHISSIGITPNQEMKSRQTATDIYETNIINSRTNYNEKYLYAFTFAEGYCIIAAIPHSEATFMRDASLYTSVFMQVIVFAILFLFIYILIKRVIINNLNKVNNTLGQITNGNLDVTVDVRSTQEFASLSDDINSTVSTLKRYIAEAAARIDKELEYAKRIQLAAIPTKYPDDDNYEIYAKMIAAKEVGGDFYDFYEIDDDNVAFLVADVSGKGIPAAMFMMSAKTIIKDLAERGLPVDEIFMKANEKLCENNESGMFVTVWMGILNLSTGTLQYANAAHNPPLVKRADGKFEYLRSRAGFVLAGMEGTRYRANELQLEPGDRIFLYTDGVTEATNESVELYGEDRLLNFINICKDKQATELLPAIKEDIDQFVGDAPQFDDITMLTFDFKRRKDRQENDN